MSDIKIPDETVYFVYDLKEKRRVTKFYSNIGPAKSDITHRRAYITRTGQAQEIITSRYVICEMLLKLDACNQYRYNENKKSIELTDMAKAIYL